MELLLVLVHCLSFAPTSSLWASWWSPIQTATANHEERQAAL
eukprot:COSAG05_NODE_475_length_9474_cov_2.354560_5_plen_42_part_00